MQKDIKDKFDELEDLLHSIKNEVDVLKILVIEMQDFLKFKDAITKREPGTPKTFTFG
jgi:hypothetical protein